jgi:hypothetical protein
LATLTAKGGEHDTWHSRPRGRRRPVCTENNRNPMTSTGQTLTLGPDGKPIDRAIDPAGK